MVYEDRLKLYKICFWEVDLLESLNDTLSLAGIHVHPFLTVVREKDIIGAESSAGSR